MKLFSPAKVNLFLRILGRRPDGYHEIATLMQAVDLGDTLTFTLSKRDQFTCDNPQIPPDLIFGAVDLFRRKTGLDFGIEIALEKRIPVEAGLGGGSSNAATTLWALNALHASSVTEGELRAWSSEIGSDIPFFFSTGTAYCTGRGEIVQSVAPISQTFSIYKPEESLSTTAVYKSLKQEECSKVDPEDLLREFLAGKPTFVNDLEVPAFRLLPQLGELKKRLSRGFMTGSGTAFVSEGDEVKTIHRDGDEWYHPVPSKSTVSA